MIPEPRILKRAADIAARQVLNGFGAATLVAHLRAPTDHHMRRQTMSYDPAGGIEVPATSRAERAIANASRAHCTAYSVLGDGAGIRVSAESWLEQRHFYILNARHDVSDFREQAVFRFGHDLKRRHVFDALVTLTDGRRIAYTIKPESRTNRRSKKQVKGETFLDEMQEIAWWVRKRDFADDTRLLTERDIDPVEFHNARIFASVREADPEAEAAARNVVSDMVGGRSLHDLTRATGLGARGYRAFLRLIRTRALTVQPDQRITPAAIIYKEGTFQ